MPRTLTSSIVRIWSGSVSTSSWVTSIPALLTRTSSPPSSATVCAIAASHAASPVTSSSTKPPPGQLGRGLLADVLEHVGDHHPRPGLGQRSRHSGTEATGTARDEGTPARQVELAHGRYLSSSAVMRPTTLERPHTAVKKGQGAAAAVDPLVSWQSLPRDARPAPARVRPAGVGQLGDPDGIAASPVAPRSSATRRCGPSSACSTPRTASSTLRTARCTTRSSRSLTSPGTPTGSGWGRRPSRAIHAPALLAKTLTSLDVLSGGRLTVGLGMGWLQEEYAAAGVPFSGGARGWRSTCAACRRCGRRTRSSSAASSTRCRAARGPASGAATAPDYAARRPARQPCAGRAARPGLDREQPR